MFVILKLNFYAAKNRRIKEKLGQKSKVNYFETTKWHHICSQKPNFSFPYKQFNSLR